MRIDFSTFVARAPEHEVVGINVAEAADLVTMYRNYGYFRQDLISGQCFYSEQACAIYGVPFTGEAANIPLLISKTHPDDVELVARTFETASRSRCGFHLIHRYIREDGGYKHLRLVVKIRESRVEGGEFIGAVYEFYDYLRLVAVEK